MLQITNLNKNFGDVNIIENISLTFLPQKIYGILGTNGAGKSTMLRTIAGIYKQDSGTITYNNEEVYENVIAKQNIFYIPDENIYLPRNTIKSNLSYYKNIYGEDMFSKDVFERLQVLFNLDINKDIKSFSKGMRKQAILLLSLSFTPEYLILDETFDGLDPLIRIKVKKFLIELCYEKNMCLIISTHSISDIENLANEVIVLNDKTVSIQKNDATENNKYYKVQLALKTDIDLESLPLNIKNVTKLGSIYTIIFENSVEEIENAISKLSPLVFDICTLSLEELFMYEVEGF